MHHRTQPIAVAWSDGNEAALEKLSLSTLPEMDPRKSQIVELRFFAIDRNETAEVMKISRRTVKREWSPRSSMAVLRPARRAAR
jgi:hypothetical protein